MTPWERKETSRLQRRDKKGPGPSVLRTPQKLKVTRQSGEWQERGDMPYLVRRAEHRSAGHLPKWPSEHLLLPPALFQTS